MDSNYPGGLAAYIRNARKLLADSKAGKNPFTGYVPSVSYDFGSKLESIQEGRFEMMCKASILPVYEFQETDLVPFAPLSESGSLSFSLITAIASR